MMLKTTKVSSSHLLVTVWFALLASTTTGSEPSTINSTACSSQLCTYEPSDFSFRCPYSGCTEIPLNDIPDIARDVDLRGNQVQSIRALLANHKAIERMDLSANEIKEIEHKAFPPNLMVLNLSNNAIGLDVLVSGAFTELDNLAYLNLSNNKIGNLTVQDMFYKLRKLAELDLSGNGIEVISHNAITDLSNLRAISLSRNEIRVLESNDFLGLRSVVSLDLSQNKLETLPDSILTGLTSIQEVDFSDNHIQEITNTSFLKGASLQKLKLAKNQLRKISYFMFEHLQSLHFISLDDNPLESIDEGSFGGSMTSISIQRCSSLEYLKDIFSQPSKLKTVTISNNPNLKSLSATIFGGEKSGVRELDLSHNSFVSLPSNLVNWINLTSANLSGNQWNCDCNMDWIKQLPESSHVFQTLECYSPLHLKGIKITDVDASQLSCSIVSRFRRQTAIALAICFTILFLAAVIFVVQNCRHRICPSWYSTGEYKTLYSSSEATVDDDLSTPVTIKKLHEAEAVAV